MEPDLANPCTTMLAIETSQRMGSVALAMQGMPVIESSFACGSREQDLLLPSVDALLSKANCSPSELEVVAVSIGPGSFTGLRIATSTAKALALATGCRLIGVPSAWGVAEHWYQETGDDGPVLVASAAKADDCWLTRLERSGSGLVESGSTGLHRLDHPSDVVRQLCDGAVLVADDFIPKQFIKSCSPLIRGTCQPKYTALGCLAAARQLEECGRFTAGGSLEPLYPREPEAVALWRARKA